MMMSGARFVLETIKAKTTGTKWRQRAKRVVVEYYCQVGYGVSKDIKLGRFYHYNFVNLYSQGT